MQNIREYPGQITTHPDMDSESQLNTNPTIYIAVCESTPDEAELIAAELRNVGHAVQSFGFKGPDDLKKILAKNRIELVYCSADESELDIICRILDEHKHHIPIIAVATDTDTRTVAKAMEKGAQDLVSRNQPAHLRLVTERELKSTYRYRSMCKYKEAYTESEKRCRNLLDSSRDAIAYIHGGMHIHSNGVYAEMFDFESSDDLEGLPICDLVNEDDQHRFKGLLTTYDKNPGRENIDIQCRRNDGTEFRAAIELSSANIDGEACTQIIIRDQAASLSMVNELETLRYQDTVTGLYNRQAFLEEVELAITDVKNGSCPAVVFYIVIDKFSRIQSTMGIENIDEVILNISKIITDTLKENDFGARFGDNTFTILVREDNVRVIRSKAKKLVKALNTIIEVGGLSVQITASLGLASIHSTARSSYEVLAYADQACNAARQSGGNKAEAYKDTERKQKQRAGRDDLRWVNLIKSALENDLFSLAFQPIVSLADESEEIYEVLLRLHNEEGKTIDTGELLSAAEKIGMIGLIDRWLIRRALHVLTSDKQEDSETSLFIKLSSSAYSDKSLLPWLYERIKSAKIQPPRLILEITEPGAATHIRKTTNFSRTLKMIKCRVAISQFGMINNPFNLLKIIPVDFIKANPALTCDINNDPAAMQKVQEMVEAAHNMNKPIIASHVESAESMTALFQCGFNFVQGDFLQEPDTVMRFNFSGD